MKSPLRIALVDDDVNVLFLLEQTLKKAFADCEFYTFEDGRLALPYVLHHQIDLLVTDNQMPGMDGAQLVRELRTQGWGRPIIMISGSQDAEKEGLAAGITKFINKTSPDMGTELITYLAEIMAVEIAVGFRPAPPQANPREDNTRAE